MSRVQQLGAGLEKRLEPMQAFVAYLSFEYGPSIVHRHRFAVVEGVGHYGRATMTSAEGLEALFSPIWAPAPASRLGQISRVQAPVSYGRPHAVQP